MRREPREAVGFLSTAARDGRAGARRPTGRRVTCARGSSWTRRVPGTVRSWRGRASPASRDRCCGREPRVRTTRPRRGLAVGARSRGRYLFLVPWSERTLVGTAYGRDGGPRRRHAVAGVLAEAQAAFPWAGLEERSPCSSTRPRAGRGRRRKASHRGRAFPRSRGGGRRRRARLGPGVKYTTARAVAERAVDLALRRAGPAAGRVPHRETPCPTRDPSKGRSRSGRAGR